MKAFQNVKVDKEGEYILPSLTTDPLKMVNTTQLRAITLIHSHQGVSIYTQKPMTTNTSISAKPMVSSSQLMPLRRRQLRSRGLFPRIRNPRFIRIRHPSLPTPIPSPIHLILLRIMSIGLEVLVLLAWQFVMSRSPSSSVFPAAEEEPY